MYTGWSQSPMHQSLARNQTLATGRNKILTKPWRGPCPIMKIIV